MVGALKMDATSVEGQKLLNIDFGKWAQKGRFSYRVMPEGAKERGLFTHLLSPHRMDEL
jgi:hypothetical protein